MIEAKRQPSASDQTRERILFAAREVIAKKGKRGATTREIADVAGVNEATLFRHFGTKEALLIEVAQHFCGHEALREVAEHLNGDIVEDLMALGRAMLEHLKGQMDIIRWSLVEVDYEADIFSTTAWRPQIAVHAVFEEFMQRRIDAGELRGGAKQLAMIFMGLVFMHVLASHKFPDAQVQDAEKALRLYVDVFLNGVRN